LANDNYLITYTPADFSITPASLSINATAQTKIYGDSDPELIFSATGFKRSDSANVLTGGLTRIEGENVGTYAINSDLANDNYLITYTPADFSITPALLTINATAQTKIYGDPDPELTFSATGFKRSDNASVLTGGLTRTKGENVGNYSIMQGDLNASNYLIDYLGAMLTITSPVVPEPIAQAASVAIVQNITTTILTSVLPPAAQSVSNGSSIINISVSNGASPVGSATIAMASNGTLSVENVVDASTTTSSSANTTADNTNTSAEGSTDTEKSASSAETKNTTESTTAASASEVANSGATPATPVSTVASNPTTPVAAMSASPKVQSASPATTPASKNTPASSSTTTSATAKTDAAESTPASNTESKSTTTSAETKATESVAAAKASLSDNITSVKAGANGVESLKNSLADAAVKMGIPVSQATKASDSFAQILVAKLATGVPMSVATTQAQNAFNNAISMPQPTTPQAIAATSLSGSGAVNSLSSLSGATSNAGSAAFDKSLAANLAMGMNMEQAIKAAQNTTQQIEAGVKIDSTPRGGLVNGSANALSDTSPAFQNTLGSALAKGLTPEQALQRAEANAKELANAKSIDAKNPNSAISSGNSEFMKTLPAGDFSKTLSSALNRGISMNQALKNAAQTQEILKKGIEADAKNPLAGLSNGKLPTLEYSKEFDSAVSNAIAKGVTPTKAIEMATQTVKNLPKAAQTPVNSFATGKNVKTLLSSSNVFNRVLSNALNQGMTLDQAMIKAQRAEAANAALPPAKNNLELIPHK